jgi:hypothetical protein
MRGGKAGGDLAGTAGHRKRSGQNREFLLESSMIRLRQLEKEIDLGRLKWQ